MNISQVLVGDYEAEKTEIREKGLRKPLLDTHKELL